jgi:voltage-gated potassium channel
MWCVIVTMTTVGYGDIYPISHPGRLAAVVSFLVGSAILALLVASVAKAISFDEAELRVWGL